MRHLSVPSDQTQVWLERCRSEGWLAPTGVMVLENGRRAVPLNEHAPEANDPCWSGLTFVDLEPMTKGPAHWKERLPSALQQLPDDTWPSAYEIQGDVLMVKLEEAAMAHKEAVGQAMLDQLSSVRVVCADMGVKGDFRVRELEPLAWRGDEPSTQTEIREHGHRILVDPSKVYFSSRLSTQRMETLQQLRAFSDRLGRPLVVADPYAGAGPAFPLLLADEGLIAGLLAGDLNPSAVELLEVNLERWTAKRDAPLTPSVIVCEDARAWKNQDQLCGRAHALLVNLPHDSFEHLPDLFLLFDRSNTSLLRGWAIVERDSLPGRADRLNRLVASAGGTASETHVSEIKGFSTTRCFVVFQTTITWD
jgi:tRNA (guanine37-N1)-methyltransferase